MAVALCNKLEVVRNRSKEPVSENADLTLFWYILTKSMLKQGNNRITFRENDSGLVEHFTENGDFLEETGADASGLSKQWE